MVCQGGCCYDHVIPVTNHKIPVFLRYFGQNLSHQSLKSRRGVAQAKGHPLPLVQPQFTCESSLLSVLLPQRDLPEGRTEVHVVKNLASPCFESLSSPRGIGYASFFCHCVQVTKVATKPKLPPFLAMTTTQAQGDFEGSIMSVSSIISISARHASNL